MAIQESLISGRPMLQGLNSLWSKWGWFLVLGILLIVLGMLSIGAPLAITLTTVMIFGSLLVIGGVAEILVFNGWSWVMLALAVRKLPQIGTAA